MTRGPIRLAVLGASGRLGQMIVAKAAQDSRFELAYLLVHEQSTHLGEIAIGSLRYEHTTEALGVDVLIDVSLPESVTQLSALLGKRTALVSGVTGYSSAQWERLRELARTHAVLHTHNFSKGIALLEVLLQQAAKALPEFDLAISDLHHRHKRDAPSGTAKTLLAATGREAPIQSQRLGSIIGEHTVHFAGFAEELLFTHRATDRNLFALGALDAAGFIAGKPSGSYRMHDCLWLAD